MFENIQQYLLTRYPILWNIKLVPILLATILSQVVFFLLGYILTDTSPQHYSIVPDIYFLLFAASLLVGTLILIFWLIRYNRNNGLRAFYPYTTLQLYLEWICILLVCISIGFVPFALGTGKNLKWQKVVSKTELKQAMDILYKVNMLIPDDKYKYELTGNHIPLLVGDADVDRTKFDTKKYNYLEDATTPDNPIEFLGPSFLYIKENVTYSYWSYNIDATEIVHKWLLNQDEDSIRSLMHSYLELQKKHNFKTNIDVESWMSIVYNPPLYPVNELINKSKMRTYEKYTEFDNLFSYYNQIESNYGQDGQIFWAIIVVLPIALTFSLFIFSSRVTSGRFWIYSLLTAGILIFIFFILFGLWALTEHTGSTYPFAPTFWLILFCAIATILGIKISSGSKKGRSNILVNLGLWMIPAIIPLISSLYIVIIEESKHLSSSEEENIVFIIIIINIIAVTIAMFPISMLIRKWKSLPEE